MRDLAAVVEGIRAVREAKRRFLRLWRLGGLERWLLAAPAALDRLAADVARAPMPGEAHGSLLPRRGRVGIDGSALYRRGRLDDEI